MKVTNQPPHINSGADAAQSLERTKSTARPGATPDGKSQVEGTEAAAGSSAVELSDNARLMRQASEAAKAAPALDAGKVERLKEQIRSGTYRVDAEAIAERILEDHFNNHFGKNDL